MEERLGNVVFETLYGWKSSKKYMVPVLREYPAADDCLSLSLNRNGIVPSKGKVIQEYDSRITGEDVAGFYSIIRDLQMEGIMIGKADEIAKKEAEKYNIEIMDVHPRARLRVKRL